MKPAKFDFRAPGTLEAVLEDLATYGEDARILAGGQSLVPLMNLRMFQPEVLISINACPDLAIVQETDREIVIGAAVRQWDVETHPVVREHCPLLVQALKFVGGRSNRNRGTVCGSLAHSDTLAELPIVAVVLGAQMVVNGSRGRRAVAAEDFFLGPLETCIQPDEMLECVTFPKRGAGEFGHFSELGIRNHGFAVSGVGVTVRFDDRATCADIRIAVMGGHDVAQRPSATEQFLKGRALDDTAVEEAGRLMMAEVEMAADIHADSDYRASLAGTLLTRSLAVITQSKAAEGKSEAGGALQ
ncbi:FAD binding domain-containing protein [Limibacillus halophilus]|uniref:CO/xanthine dehydrogenase FAD-binding subunit n=1 Tax=Limibacillus halophilus TaxID=1579333 RepID=A0A839SW21_9PROT|nr:FAD binding domain-containing protein [Limibacillus halophilus]MBB3066991.1 CO/xanthine dehydrogenase FAD-binding subunit [Limibacillus halophilus]